MLDYKKFIELEGSEKQIAWAEDIRRNYAFNHYNGRCYKDLAEIYANATEEEKEKVRKLSAPEKVGWPFQLIVALVEEPSAKWWIENRPINSLDEMFPTLRRKKR